MQSQVNDLASAFVESQVGDYSENNQDKFSSTGPEPLARLNACLERAAAERNATLHRLLNEFEKVTGAIADDMRGPLRAIQSSAFTLHRQSVEIPLEQLTEHARQIMRASSRLDKLVQNAIAYNSAMARILPLQSVELSGILKRIVERYPEFQPGNADIRIEGSLPIVLGNETLLAQCFCNLIDNAVKFVPSGTLPHIRIYSERTSDTARIWVKDNAIGIPRHAQQQLFGLFQKTNPDCDGTGLGLVIVRRIVERMDGKVGFDSEPGRGSCFWVELKTADGH